MATEDGVRRAAALLTGAHAPSLVEPVVRPAGGAVQSVRPCHVRYRPGRDVVVRFTVVVRRRDGTPATETVLAGTSVEGPPPGSTQLVVDDDGRDVGLAVWRWPFDPVLAGLPAGMTPSRVGRLVRGHLVAPLRVEAVGYRPLERVVLRLVDREARCAYVSIVEPARVGALVDRHLRLGAGGIPVPEVIAVDATRGWFACAELRGRPLLEPLAAGAPSWPSPHAIVALLAAIGTIDLPSAAPARSAVPAATAHMAMLAAVVPDQAPRIGRMTELLAIDATGPVASRTIHGDLQANRLLLDGERIIGLLDADGAGPGDPLDDLATLLGVLTCREVIGEHRRTVEHHVTELQRAAARTVDPHALAVRTAAVVAGLASDPFRLQHHEWRHAVRDRLARAEAVLESAVASQA